MLRFGMDFDGAKLVCLVGGRLLTLLRDDDPGISFPGYWDLPGGGREGQESAEDCILRETHEEFGLMLAPEVLVWRAEFASATAPERKAIWFAARLPEARKHDIVFGDEGQRWELMRPADWIGHPMSVPHFRVRVRAGLAALKAADD